MKRKHTVFKNLGLCMAAVALSVFAAMPCYADANYYVDPEKPYDAPIHGMFHEQPVVSDKVNGTYSVYIPAALQPWRPVVIILPPDHISAKDFAAGKTGSQWIAAAEKYQFAAAFLQSDGTWNLEGTEDKRNDAEYLRTVYTQLRSKSAKFDAVFTTDKSHISLIGYEEGGAAAYEIAAQYPAIFCNVTSVDASAFPSELLAKSGEQNSFPFPADSFSGQDEIALKNDQIPVPVWSVGTQNSDAVAYWMNVNGDQAETRVVPEVKSPEAIWTEFMSRNGRFLGYPGGSLFPTESFTAKADGSGYHVSEQNIDGYIRRWMTYVPESYQAGQPAPMVLVSHGYSASMYALAEESKWADVADRYGIIVVFPQAYLNERSDGAFVPVPAWNSGLFSIGAPQTDDVSFIRHVIDLTKSQYTIDASRVYATGHSNGGSLTWLLGRSMPEILAAIAPVGLMSGGEETDDMSLLLPSWSFKGEYDGDGMALTPGSPNRNALDFWKSWNGVKTTSQTKETEGLFTTYSYTNDQGVPLVRYTGIKHSPHAYLPEESWLIWENFFSKYSRGEDGTLYYEGTAVSAAEK